MNQTMNGMMFPIGSNFVEIAFKRVLEHGWEGVSLLMFLQFWLYQSMDHIKDLIKKGNDYISTLIRSFIESYLVKLTTYISQLPEKLVHVFHKNTQIQKNATEPVAIDKQQLSVSIGIENKIDLMALISDIFANKRFVATAYERNETSKYNTVAEYLIPSELNWIVDDVKITLQQNIELKASFDVDEHSGRLKNVSGGKKPSIIETSVSRLDELIKDFTKTIDFPDPPSHMEGARFNGWNIGTSITNDQFKRIEQSFLLADDKNGLLTFFMGLIGIEDIFFNGRIYKIKNGRECLPTEFHTQDKKVFTQKFDDLWTNVNVQKWRSTYEQIVNTKLSKNEIESWKNLRNYFKQNATAHITLTFSTASQDFQFLEDFSRKYFFKLINRYYDNTLIKKVNDKISIHKLNIIYETKKEKVPNPYFVKVSATEKEDSDDEGSTKQEKSGDDKEHSAPPKLVKLPKRNYWKQPEFIEVDKPVAVLQTQHIKKDRKPFEYLYLQNNFKQLLENYLINFRDGRTNYEKFGIPYKGGIILTGLPGCGKSSTIVAIGTFLGKDIFYIDLGGVKTNTDLKKLVDHVKLTSKNGGIIIFEDIDCMTDIVLARTDPALAPDRSMRDPNFPKSQISDALSLSFLLNLLDGTMAPEDVIFIMTTNHIEKLDPALVRPGRMDICIELKRCDRFQLSNIFKDIYGVELTSEILASFPENRYMVSEIILHLFHNIYSVCKDPRVLLQKFLVTSESESDSSRSDEI
jgi:hypothetical protein